MTSNHQLTEIERRRSIIKAAQDEKHGVILALALLAFVAYMILCAQDQAHKNNEVMRHKIQAEFTKTSEMTGP